jgi:hypothetical protein
MNVPDCATNSHHPVLLLPSRQPTLPSYRYETRSAKRTTTETSNRTTRTAHNRATEQSYHIHIGLATKTALSLVEAQANRGAVFRTMIYMLEARVCPHSEHVVRCSPGRLPTSPTTITMVSKNAAGTVQCWWHLLGRRLPLGHEHRYQEGWRHHL